MINFICNSTIVTNLFTINIKDPDRFTITISNILGDRILLQDIIHKEEIHKCAKKKAINKKAKGQISQNNNTGCKERGKKHM